MNAFMVPVLLFVATPHNKRMHRTQSAGDAQAVIAPDAGAKEALTSTREDAARHKPTIAMADLFFKLDKTALSVTSFAGADKEDKAHWFSKTPQERLAALERMRQINYAYDPASDRIQRTLEIAERL